MSDYNGPPNGWERWRGKVTESVDLMREEIKTMPDDIRKDLHKIDVRLATIEKEVWILKGKSIVWAAITSVVISAIIFTVARVIFG
jgi:hypothetical protein